MKTYEKICKCQKLRSQNFPRKASHGTFSQNTSLRVCLRKWRDHGPRSKPSQKRSLRSVKFPELKIDNVLLMCDSGEARMNKHLALSAEFIRKACSNFVGEISGVED